MHTRKSGSKGLQDFSCELLILSFDLFNLRQRNTICIIISANVNLVTLPEHVTKAMEEFGDFTLQHFSPSAVVEAIKEVQVSKAKI